MPYFAPTRYTLERDLRPLYATGDLWADALHDDRLVVWIMLNPSTADDHDDDPTIRRVIRFTHREGGTHLRVVNLCPLRATNPADLRRIPLPASAHTLLGNNITALGLAIVAADLIVCAWGAHAPNLPITVPTIRPRYIAEAAELAGKPLHCLGTTKDGHPRHPLYLRHDTPLEEYHP